MQMKKEQRIFIKNLPEAVTHKEIKTIFSKYGIVTAVDIKQRKSIPSPSKFFAYVTVKIDSHRLQKCFNYFANNLWHGENLELELAKQSFLERLRQEREGSNVAESDEHVKESSENIQNGTQIKEESLNVCNGSKIINMAKLKAETESSEFPKTECDDLPQSELKRVQSVNQMIKGYHQQKSAIKAALSNIDFKPNNKIIFDEGADILEETSNKLESKKENGKNILFEDDEDSDNDINFEVKASFEGKRGKELFRLQSRYKNDSRFVLNERFIEDDDSNESKGKNVEQTSSDEKKRQFEILEQVLGNKFKSKTSNNEKDSKRGMLRFDPAQAEHLQYEIKNTENHEKNKRRRKNSQSEDIDENIEIQQSKVSKQVFYNVSEDLKGTFQNEEKFSLLNLFGDHEKPPIHEEVEEQEKILKPLNSSLEVNPFSYDSSDDGMEETHVEDKRPLDKNEDKGHSSTSKLWTEPFFFRNDDYRLQEGLDFVGKMASKRNDEFMALRKGLKEIVKAKVRNNHRKNAPFKKKLGGSKKKKNIRLRKAMKR